jgi:hypothetical protein
MLVDVQEDIATPGISVFGFSDGANVDGMAKMRPVACAIVQDAMVGFVRVAEA